MNLSEVGADGRWKVTRGTARALIDARFEENQEFLPGARTWMRLEHAGMPIPSSAPARIHSVGTVYSTRRHLFPRFVAHFARQKA